MCHNYKSMIILFLVMLNVSSLAGSLNAANINIHARTQDNDGIGIVTLHVHEGNDFNSTYTLKPGESLTTDMDGITSIEFKSIGRHDNYNANLYSIDTYHDYYLDQNISVDVNFYKKSCYYNKFWIAGGWWSANEYRWSGSDDGFRYHIDSTNKLSCGELKGFMVSKFCWHK